MSAATKTLDESFRDYEASAFGFGYGTGEAFIVPALHRLFSAIPDRLYAHTALEEAVGGPAAWLLINVLCREGNIEYGTSPRFGWLTPSGERLRSYLLAKTPDELLEVLAYDENYIICSRDSCNCGPEGYEPGRKCANPFWEERA